MVLNVFSLSLLVPKLLAKSVGTTKSNFFCLICPGKVKMLPNVVKSGMVGFRTCQTFRLSLLRSFIAIRGRMS